MKLICEVAAKLCKSAGRIGICCVSKCAQFWTNEDTRNAFHKALPSEYLGVVYLVRSNGEIIRHNVHSLHAGRFVLVEIDG